MPKTHEGIDARHETISLFEKRPEERAFFGESRLLNLPSAKVLDKLVMYESQAQPKKVSVRELTTCLSRKDVKQVDETRINMYVYEEDYYDKPE